jgi:hypothetical protein
MSIHLKRRSAERLSKAAFAAFIFAFYRLVAFQRVERTNLRIALPVYRPVRQSVDWYGFGPATLPSGIHHSWLLYCNE